MAIYKQTYFYTVYKMKGDDTEYSSLWLLRKSYPNLIFSNNASDELLASIGISKLTKTEEREIEIIDPKPEDLVDLEPVEKV